MAHGHPSHVMSSSKKLGIHGYTRHLNNGYAIQKQGFSWDSNGIIMVNHPCRILSWFMIHRKFICRALNVDIQFLSQSEGHISASSRNYSGQALRTGNRSPFLSHFPFPGLILRSKSVDENTLKNNQWMNIWPKLRKLALSTPRRWKPLLVVMPGDAR